MVELINTMVVRHLLRPVTGLVDGLFMLSARTAEAPAPMGSVHSAIIGLTECLDE